MMVLSWTALALAASVNVGPNDDLQALTSSLNAGDIVLFDEGVYELEGTVSWTGLGTADEPITFKARDNAEVILRNLGGGYVARITESEHIIVQELIFEGGPDSEENGTSGFNINESSHITLENSTVRDVWNNAVRIDGNTNNLTLVGNNIHSTGNGTGLSIGCGDASCWMQESLIATNQIHDVGGTGIELNAGCQDNDVTDNVIYRAERHGIYLGPTELGEANRVMGNAVWQSTERGIFIEGAARVQNNVVFETQGDGIFTNNNDRDGLYDLVISHNTVAMCDGWCVNLDDWYEAEDMVFANNAIANPTGYGLEYQDLSEDLGVDTNNWIRNNVVTGLVSGVDTLTHPEWIIPGGGLVDFEDGENWDFYPSQTGVLLNAGDADGNSWIPEIDFNGLPRDGAAPDCGAYEWDAAGNPGWIVQEGFKEETTAVTRNSANVDAGCCGKDSSAAGVFFLPLLMPLWFRRRRQ